MPIHCGIGAGNEPSPISVEVTGKPVSSASSRSARSLRPRIDDAAAGVEDRPLGRSIMSTACSMAGVARRRRVVALVPRRADLVGP
jgi:hypothetical protein